MDGGSTLGELGREQVAGVQGSRISLCAQASFAYSTDLSIVTFGASLTYIGQVWARLSSPQTADVACFPFLQ